MVCDGAMVASTVVSLMMNGMCCMYQQQEEAKRSETIRRDIRAEYWHQRLVDHELLSQRKDMYQEDSISDIQATIPQRHNETSSSSSSSLILSKVDHRRRQLVMDKIKASSYNFLDDMDESCDPTVTSSYVSYGLDTDSLPSNTVTTRRRSFYSSDANALSRTCSLVDDDNDEDSDDENVLMDVSLQ